MSLFDDMLEEEEYRREQLQEWFALEAEYKELQAKMFRMETEIESHRMEVVKHHMPLIQEAAKATSVRISSIDTVAIGVLSIDFLDHEKKPWTALLDLTIGMTTITPREKLKVKTTFSLEGQSVTHVPNKSI